MYPAQTSVENVIRYPNNVFFFFLNDPPPTEFSPLPPPAPLPISSVGAGLAPPASSTQKAPLAPWEVDWCQPIALLVGNEGAGLPEEIERSADARIRIPMASGVENRKSTRLNSSHGYISYAVFCLK